MKWKYKINNFKNQYNQNRKTFQKINKFSQKNKKNKQKKQIIQRKFYKQNLEKLIIIFLKL